MDGPSLSHCMVDEKSARRCSSRFFDNFECRSRNSIGCADNPNLVRCVNRVHLSRGLSMVETEESAEAVAPLHGGGRALRRCRVLQKPIVEPLMVSLPVVVLRYSRVRRRKWPSPSGTTRLRHSSLIDRTNLSAYALRFGLLGGSRIGWIPALVRISAKTAGIEGIPVVD